MDIAELRNKLNNIAAEIAEQDVQQEDIAIEEDDMSTGTAGGVAGQGKKRRATGINDNPYDHNEGQDLAALVNAALWNMKDVYQTVLAGEELSERDIFSYGDLVQYLEMEELPDTYSEFYDLVSDAIDSASGGGEFNPGDAIAVDKNIAPKIKTLYQQFKAATAKIEGIKEEQVEEVEQPVAEEEFAEEDDLEIPEEQEEVAEEEVEETVEIPIAAIAELMQLAGFEGYKPVKEFANSPEGSQGEPAYMDAEDQMIGMSGGLNGPKKMYPAAAGGDNPMDQEPREIEEVSEDVQAIAEVENTLYKSYRAFLEEQEISNQEEN